MGRRTHKEDKHVTDPTYTNAPNPGATPEEHRAKKMRRAMGRPLLYDLWGYVFSLEREELQEIINDLFNLGMRTEHGVVSKQTEIVMDKLSNLVEGLERAQIVIDESPNIFDPEVRVAFQQAREAYHADLDYRARYDDGEAEDG